MPNMGRGKQSYGTGLEDGIMGEIGRGVGGFVRDAGEGVQRGISSVLRGLGDAAHGLADGLEGDTQNCVEVQSRGVSAQIRVRTGDDPERIVGGNNQLPCPEERAARCGRRCMRTLGGNSGFPTARFGNAYPISKGQNE